MQNFLVFAALIALSSAHTGLLREGCPPKPPTKLDFDATKYLGDWYQVTGIPAFFQPSGTSCVKATYNAKDDGTVGVRNTATKPDGETFQEICGYADVPDPSKPGELQVHFPFSPAGDYWVIDTDYESFTSIYSCQDVLGLFRIEFAWILVRDLTNVPEESMKRAMEAFTSNGLATDAFEDVVQEGCTYVDPSGAEPCVP